MRALRASPTWLGWLAFAGCAVSPLDPEPKPVDADADGVTVAGGDCDDHDPLVAPGLGDHVGNLVDENCDGVDGVDGDGDGVASVSSGGVDCDDAAALVLGPGTPDPADDGVDANCDGTDGVDGDGDGSPSVASGGADCDDANADLRPGNPERCDGVDQNCADGAEDERGLVTLDDGSTFHDVDEAVRRARQGDTLVLCAGTYPTSVEIDQDLALVGLGAREDIVLDAHAAGPVLTTVGPVRLSLSHLTVQGGLGTVDARGLRVGGGLYIAADGADVVLDDVVVAGNVAEEGGGLYTAADASLLVKDSLLTKNLAQVGGAIRLFGGVLDVVGSTFVDNAAGDGGVDLVADPIVGDAFNRAPQIHFEDVEVGRHDASMTTPEDAVTITGGTFEAVGGRFSGVVGTPLVVRPPRGLTASSQVHLQGTVFEDNLGTTVGGLFDAGAAVAEVTDVVFRRNRGRYGALLLMGDPSLARNATRARLTRVTVEDNVGTQNAGALFVLDVDVELSDSTFARNHALAENDESAGGAVTARRSDPGLSRSSLQVEHCTFDGNRSEGDGGAIAVFGAFDVTVSASSLDGNSAAGDGGGLYVNGLGGAASLVLDEVSFVGHRAGGSGGAVATVGVVADVEKVRFTDCAAEGDGGAVDAIAYLDDTRVTEGSLKFAQAEGADCVAGGAGGLLHSAIPSVTVSDVIATRLSAARGGAIALDPYLRYGGWVGPVGYLSGLEISETTAVRGGFLDAVGVDLSMSDSNVSAASAQVGGAIYLEPAVDAGGQPRLYASAELDHSSFSGCAARGNLDRTRGGAIAGVGTSLTLSNVQFEDNQASGGLGGALWLGPMRQADGSIAVRSVVDVDASIFTRNGATEGGAVAIDAASGRVTGSEFTSNAASARGGSIALYDSSERPGFLPFTLQGLRIVFGSAPLGGAIYATSVDLKVVDTAIEDNSATWGAGIALDAAFTTRLYVRSGGLLRNAATVRGGGVYTVAPVDPALGMLTLEGVGFGAVPGSNTPDDLAVEGVGSTPWLGEYANRTCVALDASCL